MPKISLLYTHTLFFVQLQINLILLVSCFFFFFFLVPSYLNLCLLTYVERALLKEMITNCIYICDAMSLSDLNIVIISFKFNWPGCEDWWARCWWWRGGAGDSKIAKCLQKADGRIRSAHTNLPWNSSMTALKMCYWFHFSHHQHMWS